NRMSFLISRRRHQIMRPRRLRALDTAPKSQNIHQTYPIRNKEALMKKSIIYAALLIVIGCVAAARSNAQQTFEFSRMSCEHNGVDCTSSIDQSGGIIYGYSATDVDYWTSFDYSPEVEGWFYD